MSFDKCTMYLNEGLKQISDERYAKTLIYFWEQVKPVMQIGLDAEHPKTAQKTIDFSSKSGNRGYEKKREISEFREKSATEYYQKICDVKKRTGKSTFTIYELAEICCFDDIRTAGQDYFKFKGMIEAICVESERIERNGKEFFIYAF